MSLNQVKEPGHWLANAAPVICHPCTARRDARVSTRRGVFRASRTRARCALALAWLAAVGCAVAAEPDTEAVVVTATRHAMPALEAPASMSVVTRSEIERRGADNVLDAIRGSAGVSLQGRAIGGRQVLSLRGLDSRHTLFLVDGRRIGASDGVIGHSDFQYAWIGVDAIERIEVVRGPLSVLYGSEALGGVVNVITRAPGERWELGAALDGRHAAGGRGGDSRRLEARASGPLAEGLGLRVGASHARRDALAAVEDARIDELEGHDRREGRLGLFWRPAAGQRLEAEWVQGQEERQASARERSGARRYHETVNRIDRTMGTLGWSADWGGASNLATELRAYRAALDVVNERSAGVAVNPPQRSVDDVLDGQARWQAGAMDWTAGFEARDETLHDPGLPGGRSVARHRSLYLQDEWPLAPALRLTLGLRHDRHSLYGGEISPRAYLVWRASPELTIKGGYGRGFKAPNLKQIVPGARREGPNQFLGNPDLRAEINDSVEAGIGWRRGGLEAQLVLFDQRLDDLIEVRLVEAGPVPGTGTYTYENLARARLRGIEAALAEKLGGAVEFELGYTYLDARSGDGRRLDKRPRHRATLRLDVHDRPWRAGLRSETTTGQLLPAAIVGAPAQDAPTLTLVGAYLVRSLPAGLELTLGVDNLGNVRLADKSALFQQVEPPRTWRLVLRGRW